MNYNVVLQQPLGMVHDFPFHIPTNLWVIEPSFGQIQTLANTIVLI